MGKIEIFEPCNLLVYQKGYSVDFVKRTIENKSLNGLRIFDHLDRLPNLDFLRDYTFLTHLEITSLGDHDYSFLQDLTHLKWLAIGSGITTKHEIDLSHQTHLTFLGFDWRKNIKGLEQCQRLEELILAGFKEKNLTAIKQLAGLKGLQIKTASIKDLGGIEGCTGLESILLGNCRYLTSLGGLNHLQHLRKIELDVVSQVRDYEQLTDLPSLAELQIIDCKEIPSITFIRHFPRLKKLVWVGNTEIADGDLTPTRSLEQVFYTNRKHYNIPYPPANLRKS